MRSWDEIRIEQLSSEKYNLEPFFWSQAGGRESNKFTLTELPDGSLIGFLFGLYRAISKILLLLLPCGRNIL